MVVLAIVARVALPEGVAAAVRAGVRNVTTPMCMVSMFLATTKVSLLRVCLPMF